MTEAFIAAALRSPVGKNKGALSRVHPADLAAHVLKAVVERAGFDPAAVDDVIFGCVNQAGAQSGNIARTAWLSAGLPESVPGTTVDRQCGSAQQAIHFAAQAVQAGAHDLVLAGGVEVMSLVPMAGAAVLGGAAGYGEPFGGVGWGERYGKAELSQFVAAELIAEKWGIGRAEMERFALTSHQRAVAAMEHGLFDEEIVAMGDVTVDEGPRPSSTLEQMARLRAVLPGGAITAALASQISDGAAVVLIASERALADHGLTPLARIHTTVVTGSDPKLMLTGPIAATEQVLARARLHLDDIDAIEINEAFASVVLAWQRETGADLERTNPLGGAIALGHPMGATGARLMTTLVHHLTRTGARYGLELMCEGGGMANATVIERM